MREETLLALVNHITGIFNDAQLDDANTLSKSSIHHTRSLLVELESRCNGHLSISKLSSP
ncbi:hypothetical protein K443DRAFT_322049 [Laccaria amethystina LaAM-08-1]|uniref:Uncharacterized protein n=1 Tax=Laccaria amethystina LaAM-08-1 TaxID=1095629 RepID=A0A0C9XHM3_9AGAR|nr:hypothetical protein K443DRAFT_322049 [Laccaria amethystina LaAM-08-1]